MDAKTTEKVNVLAQNLKKMHLAATMEEAVERAKEIVLGSKSKDNEKPIGELMNPTKKDLEKAEKAIEKEEKLLKEIIEELDNLKQQVMESGIEKKERELEIREVGEDIIEEERDIGLLEENIDAAEEVQEKEGKDSKEPE